jgi:hypothetical protein
VLPERFDCQLAKDGTFVLADMPSKPFLILGATGPGVAQFLWGNARLPERRVPDSIEFELAPESRFGGTVTDAKGLPVADATVELRISRGTQSPAMDAFLARTDTAGRFQIAGLPAGPFDLTVQSPAGVMRPERVNLVKAEAKLDAQVALEDGVEVAGVVVALPGGEPVEGVGVTAITPDNLGLRLGYSVTDPQGRFSLRLATGKTKLYFSRVPTGFVYPEPQIVTIIEVAPGDAELTKLRLEVPRTK